MKAITRQSWTIRKLTAADAALYRPVRLTALRLHPEAFSSDFADESQLPPDAFAARIPAPPGALFGGIVADLSGGERLVGTAGLSVQARAKLRHKGMLYGVYVDAAYRRSGVAHGLIEAVIAQARSVGLRVVQLNVTVGNHAARALYVAHGFRSYGVEPLALNVDGALHDEELMALPLG